MDGMPLYEYARKGIPLPRPIEKRNIKVLSLEVVEWKGSDHDFRWPVRQFTEQEKKAMERAVENVEDINLKDDPEVAATASEEAPSAFVLSMKVSGGTYVRSLVHDLCHELGSAGHVVTLTRCRQGRFVLEPVEEEDRGCVPWEIFKKALEDVGGVDDDGWMEWEKEVMDKLEIVEGPKA
jgi:tRNA pseudouridine55 synthase